MCGTAVNTPQQYKIWSEKKITCFISFFSHTTQERYPHRGEGLWLSSSARGWLCCCPISFSACRTVRARDHSFFSAAAAFSSSTPRSEFLLVSSKLSIGSVGIFVVRLPIISYFFARVSSTVQISDVSGKTENYNRKEKNHTRKSGLEWNEKKRRAQARPRRILIIYFFRVWILKCMSELIFWFRWSLFSVKSLFFGVPANRRCAVIYSYRRRELS